MLHVDEDRLRWSAPSRAQLDRFAAVVARHALTLIAPGDQVPFGEMCETVARDAHRDRSDIALGLMLAADDDGPLSIDGEGVQRVVLHQAPEIHGG